MKITRELTEHGLVIFEEGFKAYGKRKQIINNPYSEQTEKDKHAAWYAGFVAAANAAATNRKDGN